MKQQRQNPHTQKLRQKFDTLSLVEGKRSRKQIKQSRKKNKTEPTAAPAEQISPESLELIILANNFRESIKKRLLRITHDEIGLPEDEKSVITFQNNIMGNDDFEFTEETIQYFESKTETSQPDEDYPELLKQIMNPDYFDPNLDEKTEEL